MNYITMLDNEKLLNKILLQNSKHAAVILLWAETTLNIIICHGLVMEGMTFTEMGSFGVKFLFGWIT